MIRNIIWDLDGTLFDTYPAMGRAFQLAAADLGADNVPIDFIISTARVSLDHCVDSLSQRYGFSADAIGDQFTRRYAQITPLDQPPFAGVREICELILSRSGLNVIVTHRRAAGTEKLLTTHQMTSLFADRVTADDGFANKPDPQSFLAMLDKHHLDKAETLAVGDRDIDVLAGQAAGLAVCYFGDTPHGVKPELSVSDFSELLTWLRLN
jgi:phosphoglycolate phosphatase-like HAD superfamily hydrolase